VHQLNPKEDKEPLVCVSSAGLVLYVRGTRAIGPGDV